MDGLGNRKGMDVSFWLVESLTVGGSSYTSGLEAARYHSASGTLQVQYGTNIWQIGGFVSARYGVCATGFFFLFLYSGERGHACARRSNIWID